MDVGFLDLSIFEIRRTDTNSLLRMVDQLEPLLSGANAQIDREPSEQPARSIRSDKYERAVCVQEAVSIGLIRPEQRHTLQLRCFMIGPF
jgi:hypothetical protein